MKIFENEYHPTEIARKLKYIIGADFSDKTSDDLDNALYDLYACASNEYNRDSFRVFYRVLESLCYKIDTKSVV